MLLADVDGVGYGVVGGIIVGVTVALAKVLTTWFDGRTSITLSQQEKKSLSDRIASLEADIKTLTSQIIKANEAHKKCEERSAKQDLAIKLLLNRASALDKILEDVGIDTSSLHTGESCGNDPDAVDGPKTGSNPRKGPRNKS